MKNAESLSLLQRLQALLQQGRPVLLAIDGPCSAGKSTLAAALAQRFAPACVLHLDDFFLQPHQRTPQRLAQPGGNVDHERLLAQALLPLRAGQAFTYQAYDCQTGQLQQQQAKPAALNIIEGSYSHHPALREYYDLAVFIDIDPALQGQRLAARESAESLERFRQRWIPLEDRYFAAYEVAARSDLRISQDELAQIVEKKTEQQAKQ